MAARDRRSTDRGRPAVQRNQGPTWSAVSARTTTTSCSGSSGSISTMIRPSSRRSSTTRDSSATRVAADADVAVEEQRGPPPARAGDAVEHRPLEHVDAAAVRATSRNDVGDVDAEREDVALGERHEVPARPAPDVERGSLGVVERALLGGAGRREPAVRREVEHAPVDGAEPRRSRRRRSCGDREACERRRRSCERGLGARPRPRRRACRRRAAHARSATREPERRRSRATLLSTGVVPSTSRRRRTGPVAGARTPIVQYPPSRAGPSTASVPGASSGAQASSSRTRT